MCKRILVTVGVLGSTLAMVVTAWIVVGAVGGENDEPPPAEGSAESTGWVPPMPPGGYPTDPDEYAKLVYDTLPYCDGLQPRLTRSGPTPAPSPPDAGSPGRAGNMRCKARSKCVVTPGSTCGTPEPKGVLPAKGPPRLGGAIPIGTQTPAAVPVSEPTLTTPNPGPVPRP